MLQYDTADWENCRCMRNVHDTLDPLIAVPKVAKARSLNICCTRNETNNSVCKDSII